MSKDLAQKLSQAILDNEATRDFEGLALQIFRYQAQANPVYAQFLQHLRTDIQQVKSLQDIPFLPISAFKYHTLQSDIWQPECVFQSSGTTGQQASRHLLRHADWYHQLAERGILEQYQRPVEAFCTVALLPSYMERGGSSLVFMVENFIQKSRYKESGFFLDDRQKLAQILTENAENQRPTLFFGVSYALLDFAQDFPAPLAPNIRIVETGGMKGRRRETTKEELHASLQAAFPLAHIDSEYGMTELLSQAYLLNGQYFLPNSTMRVLLREPSDPRAFVQQPEKTGAINVADLANLHTLSFIATDDLGRLSLDAPHAFKVLGRFDAADIRGCNLLVN